MPIPVSREFMRGLKAKKEDEKRIKGVNQRVEHIYNMTLDAAVIFSNTFYSYPIIQVQEGRQGKLISSDSFYREGTNMKDILVCLQILFPDCLVTHVNQGSENEGILIDWS